MLDLNSVLHEGPAEVRGPEGFHPFWDRMQAAFSDIKITVHDEIAEGDKVCLRWSCTMRHTGAGFGGTPTNKQLETTGMTFITVAGGKFGEAWQNWDMLSLLQQIGSEPPASTYLSHSPSSNH
jgi:predicted ester cyclase